MASPASSTSSDSHGDVVIPAAPASVVQQVNIRSHVPIILDLKEPNFSQWRCFFDSILGKFGLGPHVFSPPPLDERDAEWTMNDHSVVNWLYTTIHKSVFDNVYRPRASAFTIWTAIEGLFHDNELERAVYKEAEFRSFQQGELSISDYCTHLKKLADELRDLGRHVSEPSQVLNLLRGLNPRYRHLKPVITAKFPPHTFSSARSYLLLEELCEQHEAKTEANHALYAGHSSSANNSSGGDGSGSGGSRNKPRQKKRGRGSGPTNSNPGSGAGGSGNGGGRSTNSGNSGGGSAPHQPQGLPWAAGYNPWTGLVQAWPMAFRAPGAGVLGPRPQFQPQNAMMAQHQLGLPGSPAPSSSSAWDQSALLAALSNAGADNQTPPSASNWYLDTGASTHMSNMAGSSNQDSDAPM
ncbi:unnamed protein product [Urochloa humidicola]